MAPIEFRLIPTPGAKPEFLAVLEPIQKEDGPSGIWKAIAGKNKTIILEGYTRDSWALDTSVSKWSFLQVQSVDGRNKLPGFVKYLRERQKTCFGRFIMKAENETGLTTFVWVISHKQTTSSQLSCRVAPIDSIPKCPLRPKSATIKQAVPKAPATKPQPSITTTAAANNNNNKSKHKKKGFGLLGNLVGAQKRTNHQVVTANTAAAAAKTQRLKTSAAATGDSSSSSNNNSQAASEQEVTNDSTESASEPVELMTSGQILSDFRYEMEQKMLDFDIAPDMSIKIHVKLSDHTKKVQEADKGKVTMEVLKYIVYEQAEEVNEDWIAHKEPGEFTDEITVAIYKDAESAPPEVMEEVNRAEIPEEMRIQQAKAEQKRRQQEINALRIQEALKRQALRKMAESSEDQGGGLSVLNTEKRDLRTIEEIQQDSAKRRKTE